LKIAITLLGFLRKYRRTATSLIYASIAATSYSIAFLLRFALLRDGTARFLWSLLLLVVIRVGFALVTRLGIGSWRYVGIRDLFRLTLAITAGSILFFAITWWVPGAPHVPRFIIVLEWLLTGNLTATVWITYRYIFERQAHRERGSEEIKRVLVVGAGLAGQMLVREMARVPTGYTPVGFVDDDPMKWGILIHGIEVIGSVDDLAKIAEECEVEQIFIVIPSAEPAELRRIIELCENLEIGFKLLPGIREVIEGDTRLNTIEGSPSRRPSRPQSDRARTP